MEEDQMEINAKMVKDLRTNWETGNTTAVLDGDIDGLIEAYLQAQVGTN